jgi:WD40 repeat protein
VGIPTLLFYLILLIYVSLAIAPGSNDKFVSSGCDNACVLWDIKSGKAEQTFTGHEQDVNCVTFFPNGTAFASGSDDYTCRLFDIRADRELNQYKLPNSEKVVTSLSFSLSGRILFTAYEDAIARSWDTQKSEVIGELKGHDQRISSVDVSSDGTALATGSWDHTIRVRLLLYLLLAFTHYGLRFGLKYWLTPRASFCNNTAINPLASSSLLTSVVAPALDSNKDLEPHICLI